MWNDQYMVWDPDSYEGVDTLTLPQHKLWLPDVIPYVM